MTQRYAITHLTEYRYASPVAISHNEARLRPRVLPYQTVEGYAVTIDPTPNARAEFRDYFGNAVDYFELHEPLDVLRVRSETVVVRDVAPTAPKQSLPWERLVDTDAPKVVGLRFNSPLVRRSEPFRAYAAPSFTAGRPIFEAARDLTARIHADFAFDPTATDVGTPVEDVLAARAGVCQDFAHVQIACLRSMGLAARYVSGYLRTLPPPGRERLVGADASHAWVAVYCGENEWIEFDPTNDMIPGDGHVTVGWGRDYGDVPPVNGVLTGGGTTGLSVSVDVEPVETTA